MSDGMVILLLGTRDGKGAKLSTFVNSGLFSFVDSGLNTAWAACAERVIFVADTNGDGGSFQERGVFGTKYSRRSRKKPRERRSELRQSQCLWRQRRSGG